VRCWHSEDASDFIITHAACFNYCFHLDKNLVLVSYTHIFLCFLTEIFAQPVDETLSRAF
jgi:hypothetical protein